MFIRKKEPFSVENTAETWNALVREERLLRRKRFLSRLLPPVGTVIFLFNLLLVTTCALRYLCGEKWAEYFELMPVLPKLAAPLLPSPNGWGSVAWFLGWFGFLIPLGICALTAAGFYVWDYLKYKDSKLPRPENEAQCAKAMAYRAEALYEIRKGFPNWSIFAEAGILTLLLAVPIVLAFVKFAGSDEPMILQMVAALFALLVCLFVLYWLFVLLFQIFCLLNSLLFFAKSEWKYWELYHRMDAYWESVDPAEFAKRERRAKREKEKKERTRRLFRRKKDETAQLNEGLSEQ